MKILAWNCRGIANSATVRQLKAMIREMRPDIVFLSETKIQLAKMSNIARAIGFNCSEIIPARGKVGIAGGLCLSWSDNIQVQVLFSCRSFISVKISGNNVAPDWVFIGVYAPSINAKQKRLWFRLSNFLKDTPLPSIIMGDFNNCVNQDEKEGGNQFSYSKASPFIEFIHTNDLIDIGFKGPPFTWINKQHNIHTIQIRLDRGLANAEWRSSFPHACISHRTRIKSDHSPLLLDTNEDKKRGQYPFKFEECWTRDPRSSMVVASAWQVRVEGSIPMRFCKKINNTRAALKKWNRNEFGSLDKQIMAARNQLNELQYLPRTHTNSNREYTLSKDYDELLTRWDWLWRQKSRVKWVTEGDRATKFFFLSTVIRRRRRNAIDQLMLPDGVWTSNRARIGTCFVQYYAELFKSSCPISPVELSDLFPSAITHAQNEMLRCSPSLDEVKQVVFSIGGTRAPGPDGMSAIFYHHYWETVGTDLFKLVTDFFRTGIMFKDLNHNYVALIPKIKTPTSVNHFRPISLCNVAYKMISKILANRLKGVLDNIISPLQNAFLHGRSISDNIVLTQELIHKIRKKTGNNALMAIKFDMAKAYDRVEWSFLGDIMHCLCDDPTRPAACFVTRTFKLILELNTT